MSRHVVSLFSLAMAGCGDGQTSNPVPDVPSDAADTDDVDDVDDTTNTEGPAPSLSGWHWEDANGVVIGSGLGFVDDLGFYWTISLSDGRALAAIVNKYFTTEDCTGQGYSSYTPTFSMSPFQTYGTPGYFYIDDTVPTSVSVNAPSGFSWTSDAPTGACLPNGPGSQDLFPLDQFVYDEDLEPPDVQFALPLVRVRN